VRPTIDKSEKGARLLQSVPAASTASTTVSRQRRQRWPMGCSTTPHIVCSLIGSCESKVGHSIRSPMRQSDTLRCDPMQRSSWPIPLRPADTDSHPRIKCCVRSSTDAADTSGGNSWALSSTLGASIRSSFLPITGHVGNGRESCIALLPSNKSDERSERFRCVLGCTLKRTTAHFRFAFLVSP